jgi:hypothetical protein
MESYWVSCVYGGYYIKLFYMLVTKEFSCHLVSEHGVHYPCLLLIGMKRLGTQQVALLLTIQHPSDELKKFSVLSQGT